MKGNVSHETEVNVQAKDAWELLSTLEFARVVQAALPHIFIKVEILEGNGGEGTILKLTFPEDKPGFNWFREIYLRIDHEKRVKETEIIEGGYLNLGFKMYKMRFEVIEKEVDSCTIRTSIEYEIKEEFAANVSLVRIETLALMISVAKDHLLKNKINIQDSEQVPLVEIFQN